MDYLDIILYIVFAIIGIFSSINSTKVKKQAEKRQKTVPVPSRPEAPMPIDEEDEEACVSEYESSTPDVVTLDDIFKALREGIPLDAVRKETPIVEPEPKDDAPAEHAEEGVSVTQGNNFTENEISDNGIYTDQDSGEAFSVEGVDWRQAVITSEILNRKY